MRTRPDLAPVTRPAEPTYYLGDPDFPPRRGRVDPPRDLNEPLVEHAGTGTLYVVAALLALGLLVVVLALG